MSTTFYATTALIDDSFELHAEQLREQELPNPRVNLEVYRSLPAHQQESISSTVRMKSRGAWAMDMLYRLCRMANQDELLFLSGDTTSSLIKAIAILAEDEDDGATYISEHGFILNEPAMHKTVENIASFFEWSVSNIDILASDELMGYFAYKDDIAAAINNPIIFQKLSHSSSGAVEIVSNIDQINGFEDGDGPWYFYSWLHSVQQVIVSALILRQKVLHTVDYFE